VSDIETPKILDDHEAMKIIAMLQERGYSADDVCRVMELRPAQESDEVARANDIKGTTP
jgi:SOS response regulatory protein OraA/RecX